jgi:hypothetical protein
VTRLLEGGSVAAELSAGGGTVAERHALGRIAEPAEIAHGIVFGAFTGTVLHTDCGLSARFAT